MIIRSPNERSVRVLTYDFHESIGYWLCITAGAMQEALNEELSRHGITYRQFQVLGWLAHDGEELTQADLAARLRIEPPTLVGLLDRMEQQGWITRANFPGDRRKKLIRVAPDAEDVWETMVAALKRVRERATARLSPDQVESLKEMLQTIHDTLTTPAERPVAAQH
jgi:MarR family transcriptional regulator for hemolysin